VYKSMAASLPSIIGIILVCPSPLPLTLNLQSSSNQYRTPFLPSESKSCSLRIELEVRSRLLAWVDPVRPTSSFKAESLAMERRRRDDSEDWKAWSVSWAAVGFGFVFEQGKLLEEGELGLDGLGVHEGRRRRLSSAVFLGTEVSAGCFSFKLKYIYIYTLWKFIYMI
jgi:hypothetical protein